MSNTPPLSEALYRAIRSKGYTTINQTDEVVEAVLGVLAQQMPVATVDAGMTRHAEAIPVPAECRQRLYMEGKPYPRSSCAVCGQFSPRHRQCDNLLQSAEGCSSQAQNGVKNDNSTN